MVTTFYFINQVNMVNVVFLKDNDGNFLLTPFISNFKLFITM